jgi:hypothetical protein
MANTPNYDINYDDKRFQQVNTDKTAALDNMENTYNDMISQSDGYFQKQIDATNQWGETQKQNQQAQTDFAIEQIEQQKQHAKEDYTTEQSGAYADWQKQSGKYGANAEQMAAQGMQGTGYSESAQVSMYNQYQNRVAVARQTFLRAQQNYNNQINEARLQNNAALAEIAFNTLQTSLELGLQGFQYKNTLLLDKMNKKQEVENQYYQRYQDVLNQINHENAMKEEIRQYNESLAENKRQHDETLAENARQHNESLAENKRQHNETLAEDKRQYDQSFAENKRQFGINSQHQNAQLRLEKLKFNFQKQQYEDQKKNEIDKDKDDDNTDGGKVKGEKAAGQDSSTISGGDKREHGGKGGKFGTSADDYINALISSGASKDRISNEIALALAKGEISENEAKRLREIYTPKGVQY